jgi:flagellum-specific peptidoglycan hydrolase FlgJ
VTTNAKFLAQPRATQKALVRYMLSRKHGKYSADDVRAILKRYVATCKRAGLDPLLVVSQMVLETGNLTSHWSQRPRRNPAGIGVTGKPGVGISFPTWDKAVRAHVGRLLAYAIPKGGGNTAQRELIKEALAVRPLPDNRRGCAPTIEGLAGTWATDKKYADKITRVANEIRGAA